MADDQWTVARGVYEGKPMLVRTNEALRALVGDKQHKYQVGIAVPFKHSRADGFPPDEEIAGLNEIEDRIVDLFKATDGHLFAIVITTGGMREFVVYTSDPGRARTQFQTLKSKTRSHEVQFMVQEDPEWRVYTSLSSGGS